MKNASASVDAPAASEPHRSSAVLVSVIIVTYNCERYLPAAIASIFQQDFSQLELIVIDNASTDRTQQLLDAIHDPRLIRIHSETNGGPQAANLGLPVARGKYIARLDADDIALPQRLRRQYEYLEAHPDVALCGTDYETIREDGTAFGCNRSLCDPFEIRWKLGWLNFIGHSTIMIRKDVIVAAGGYDQTLWCVQDYDLISRIALSHAVSVIPELLVHYRVYPTSITHGRSAEMIRTSREVSARHLERILSRKLPPRAIGAAIDIMRAQPHDSSRLGDALGLIREYAMHCARESPAPQGRFIRTATANHLVQYARDHRPKAIARLRFEATAFMLAPRQLMKRLAGLLKRRRP